ncbi:ankyrin repeat-containing protein [Legionella wadsworthii]|uniref:Ankyrin repeat-containing protein n=1 Tax=Legionella wadsworthii TaxID=28088 RepID=A0A378LSZ0_9GAMM|nr:hypothetical protein [Legionella wadsworthii]STY28968.1 ankyrin repeat-containing protein [Legionella wadsworthii]
MPNQGKIINSVNLCLKQKGTIDVLLNKKGICAALAALYIQYSLENKRKQFFYLLNQLATLPKTHHFGTAPTILGFIIKIQKAFLVERYSNYEMMQSDVEKYLDAENKPIQSEFNLGLTTSEAHWIEIFKKIGRNNRSYLICSRTHAIALSFENGKYSYTIYDPNYNTETQEFETVEELIREIKDCFEYKENSFGLILRAFSHPNSVPETYPSHDEIHQIAFADPVSAGSCFFAAMARDRETLKYLFDHNEIDYELLGKEYFRPEFNDLLLQQPKSATLKKAVLAGIQTTLTSGCHKESEKLMDHYLQTYTSIEEQTELKNTLQQIFENPISSYLLLLKKKANFSKLLKLLEQFNLLPHHPVQRAFNHLQILTYLNQEVKRTTIEQFLNDLTPEQIIEQIHFAALANQHHVLTPLLQEINSRPINPRDFPSIINKDLIQEIDATTLKRLLENGFTMDNHDPDLLSHCLERHDKTIFEFCARAYAEQTQSNVWELVDSLNYNAIDLRTPLGTTPLLNALIFLGKNHIIKNAWNDNIPVELIKSALTVAILNGNNEMSLFLHEKLQHKKSPIEQETLEFLYGKAIVEEDISILSALVELKFNVLRNTQDIRALIELCYDYNDYSIIENCFDHATPKIKQLILESGLKWNISPIISLCLQKEPKLFNSYLNNSLANTVQLTKLNRAIHTHKIPPDTFSLNLEVSAQKKIIKDCFKRKHLNLANVLCVKVDWEEEEVNALLNELIQDKNENGIIILLQQIPKLKDREKLVSILEENHLLRAVDYLIHKEKISIDQKLTEQIFTSALIHNAKNLVVRFLNSGKITPDTHFNPSLLELLKQAIEKNNDSVLEAFIESNLDFRLDFKELFLFSCTQKKAKIANLLLAKDFSLNPIERRDAINSLFDHQPPSSLYETAYLEGYGRLYSLFLKTRIPNPRTSLLSSIKNPEKDHQLQKTVIGFSLLKRAIKEKNEKVFHILFTQSELPVVPDVSIITFLKNLVLFANVLPLFEKKYSLKKLIDEAIQQKEWATLANLIVNKKWEDLDGDLQDPIKEHGEEIIQGYLENLVAHYEKTDVRPQLFHLLKETNTDILFQLAAPYHELIHKTLEQVELNMIQKQLDLNHEIYRYTFNPISVKKALEELGKIFEDCQKIVSTQSIDLELPIENPEIINHLARMKLIMAGKDISPDYLAEPHLDLFEKLIENPRLKKSCQLEFKLYCMLKQFDTPYEEQEEKTKKEFTETIKLLEESLKQANLPSSFVLPPIQSFITRIPPPKTSSKSVTLSLSGVSALSESQGLEFKTGNQLSTVGRRLSSHSVEISTTHLGSLKKTCTDALTVYLENRDEHLSIFSYCFDYYRGKIRANHYKNLIESAQSETEIYLIEYAILINHDGNQLKKDLVAHLQLKDEHAAKNYLKAAIQKNFAVEYLPELDKLVDTLNGKINHKDRTNTNDLFQDELNYLQQMRSPQNRSSHYTFFPRKQDLIPRLIQWLTQWFCYDSELQTERSPSFKNKHDSMYVP